LDNYPRIEDNSVVSKFGYYLKYFIILEWRITDSNQSIISRKIKLLVSSPLIAN
jgi:hypothetical protein